MVFIEEIEDRPWETLHNSESRIGYIGKIPKIIHQTWRSRHVPKNLQSSISSWKRCHPDWKHILWTDQDIEDYIQHFHPELHEALSKIRIRSQRAEILSYVVLYDFGGIYSDLKYSPRKEIESFLTGDNLLYLLFEKNTNSFTNSLIISAPRIELWSQVWKKILNPTVPAWAIGGYLEKNYTTGPSMFHEVVICTDHTIGFLPIGIFNPDKGSSTAFMRLTEANTLTLDKMVFNFIYEQRFTLILLASILSLLFIYFAYRYWSRTKAKKIK